MRDGLVLVCHHLDTDLKRQVLAAPVLFRRVNKVHDVGKVAGALVAVHQNAGGIQLDQHLRQERVGDLLVHQQRLASIAHAHALGLGVHHDGARLLKVRGLVHVDMAIARTGLDHRNIGVFHAVANEPCAAARNENVHRAAQAHKHVRGSAISGLDNADCVAGQPGVLYGIRQHVGNSHAGVLSDGAAAKDAGVTRTDADARSVRGHVGSRLVHHGDKAQRHAHLLQVEPAVDGALLKNAAHRIGQGR